MKRVLLCGVLTLAVRASADEGAYLFVVGPGVAFRSFSAPVLPHMSVLVESTFGLTDRWNWELPVWVDFRSGRVDLSLGAGMEFVYLRAGHLQCNVGAGSLFAVPFLPGLSLGIGPYLETAVRWKIIWGIGVGLEVHAGYAWSLTGPGQAPFASAVLALHSEL